MAECDVTFEAVIVPHRSLGRRGLCWVCGMLVLLSALMASGLWLAGAWPAIGFTGLEAGLAVLLLRWHALGARAVEMLVLSERGLAVVTIARSGARSELVLPSAWLRTDLQERPGRTPALLLRARGVALEIAASLGEDEKRALAAALRDALERQRRPVFDNPQLRAISPPPGPST